MYCMQCILKSKYIKSRTFNEKNRWIIKKVMVLKKLLPHLATRGTYSPGDWRYDEAWREQTLVYPPVICQQRLIYCTWELNIMAFFQSVSFLSRWIGLSLHGSLLNHWQWITMNAYVDSQSCWLPIIVTSLWTRCRLESLDSRLFTQPFTDKRKNQSSVPLVFVRGIHRWPVNSPHKGPVTPKVFPFDDVIIRQVYSPGPYLRGGHF